MAHLRRPSYPVRSWGRATLADVPAERIGAESLAFINWTVLTALGVGSFAAVVAGRFRTDATRGYLGFTAFSAAVFALLAFFADGGSARAVAGPAVRNDPAWDAPRRLAMVALPILAAAYGVAVWRGRRAAPIALAGLAAAGLVLVAGALSWGGGGLGSVLLFVELAGVSAALGGVWAAMILGHWYLVTPKLPEAPLVRFAGWLGAALALQLVLFVVWLGLGAGPAGTPAFAGLVGPWALFVWLRLIVGLVFPLVVSWAAVQTARSRLDGIGHRAPAVHQRRHDRGRHDPRRRAVLRRRAPGLDGGTRHGPLRQNLVAHPDGPRLDRGDRPPAAPGPRRDGGDRRTGGHSDPQP